MEDERIREIATEWHYCSNPSVQDIEAALKQALAEQMDELNETDKYNREEDVLVMKEQDNEIATMRECLVTAYECGRNDTVESNYCDAEDRVEEILSEALEVNE